MNPKKQSIQFDDDQLGEELFEADITEDEALEDDQLLEEDDSVDMFDETDEGYFEDESSEEETIDEENDESYADDYGVSVEASDIGLSDEEDDMGDFEVVTSDTDFINQNGDIVVMDTNASGDNFSFKYIDIENIAIVKRIRKGTNVEDLIKTIKSTGLLMPVVVAPTATEDIYVLLSGYRRVLACAKVGIRRIPCIINTKVNTPEIPILEAMYNQSRSYTIKEMIDYIEYLEKEKGIMSASMIEFLLQMENGDYTKLKDILNDNDDDIVSKLLGGQMTIAQAFKKLEQRRKNESKEEKELKKVEKVYQDSEESGAEQIEGSGETSEGRALSEEEIESLAVMANNIEDDDRSLEEMLEDGKNMPGFEPKVQKVGERELVDPAMRKAVMERDHNTCRCCNEGGPEYVDVNDFHHVVPVFLGGPDTVENAICICVKCHKLVHLYARGQLHLVNIDKMAEAEKQKFKRVIKYAEIIMRGMAAKGMKLEEYKKQDGINEIGRQMPGQKNRVT